MLTTPTSGTEVKIECRHASTLPVCLHGVGREILTFCYELCVCGRHFPAFCKYILLCLFVR